MSASVGLVSRASVASALARAERDPGPSARRAQRHAGSTCRDALGPGSRCARPGHESRRAHDAREVAARESEPLAVIPDSRCQTAQHCSFPRRVAAPGFVRLLACAFGFRVRRRATEGLGASGRRDSSNSVPPMRGGWSADRRTHSFGRACDARPPCPGATGTSLGAPPWRFSDADPRSRLPAVEPEPQRLPAPGINARRSGSGPPALRIAPQRGTPLLAPFFRIVSRKRPSEPGCESCITNSLRSQYQSRNVAVSGQMDGPKHNARLAAGIAGRLKISGRLTPAAAAPGHRVRGAGAACRPAEQQSRAAWSARSPTRVSDACRPAGP